MKNIVFLDVDGTIVPDGKYLVPDITVKAINTLKEQGDIPVVCTGRNIKASQDIINQLGVDTYITSNGQQITINKELVYSSFFEKIDVSYINAVIKKYNSLYAIEDTDGIHIKKSLKGLFLKKYLDYDNFLDVKVSSDLPTNNILHFWAFGTERQLNNIERELVGVVKLYRWSKNSLEIATLSSSKGNGVKKVANYFKVNNSELKTFAFGDNVNDLSMMEVVDISVAMGNAVFELKHKCSYTTDTCELNGVGKALTHFGLIK